MSPISWSSASKYLVRYCYLDFPTKLKFEIFASYIDLGIQPAVAIIFPIATMSDKLVPVEGDNHKRRVVCWMCFSFLLSGAAH